jgi:undecaprenyl pyrophosphate synthase
MRSNRLQTADCAPGQIAIIIDGNRRWGSQALNGDAQANTAFNDTVTLTIATNSGGPSDIIQAVKSWQQSHPVESVDTLVEAGLIRCYGARERRLGGSGALTLATA